MNLNHLALFHAVAEEGSVSRGAERLCVSQPAVSRQVRELEQALGITLFDRIPKGVRLTDAGATLATYARRIFALEAEAGAAMADARGLRHGHLSIGASLTIGEYLLPAVLGAFHKTYPGIALDVQIANTERVAQSVLDGAVQIGLTEGVDAEPRLLAEPFGEDEIVAVCEPGHALVQRGPVSLSELCAYGFVVREAGSGTRAVTEQALQERGLSLSVVMSLGSTEAVKRAAAAGLGLAFVSRLAVADELSTGRLALVPAADFCLRRPLHRLRVPGASDSGAARAFLSELAGHLAGAL